jgi:arogenate dehydrogenase (NADP+), plant
MNKNITIIGYGRFGQTLYRLLKDDFDVLIYTRKPINDNINQTQDLHAAYQNKTIFYAVPIEAFEEVLASHREYMTDDHLLIDVLSVKLHPKHLFEKYLKDKKTQALLTHPMFGPDSSRDGFAGLPIVLDKFMADDKNYEDWKTYLAKKQLKVIEISADEHDRLAADSQGLTHFVGRLLDEIDLQPTPIDTVGAKKLNEIREQTCNDTWDLFTNLQHFNPYTKPMRLRLGEAYDKLYNKLIPKQVSKDHITIGIQGGKGSFNEEAVQYYLQRNKIKDYKIVYLHTTENVMRELHEGTIDQGQFAIHNSIGGIVHESVEAMAKYKFEIVEQFAIKIAHALMVKKGVTLKEIDTIMTHPQVLAQCKGSLSQKYEQLKQTSGEGELIDHALVAQALSEGKLPANIATMGSKVLADLYNLDIVEDNLQDLQENYTSFLLVKRI